MPKNECLYIDIKYNEPENNITPDMNRYATVFNSTLNDLAINPIKINPIEWKIWYWTAVLKVSILSPIRFSREWAPNAPMRTDNPHKHIPVFKIHIYFLIKI